MEIRTVWEKPVHVCNPLIDLNFGTDRTKAAFAGMRDMAYFRRMDGTGKCGETKTIRFTAIHNLPDVVSHIPGNQCRVISQERIPIFLENELKGNRTFLDGFHDRTRL
jgi:hypothetical protein